MCHNSKAPLRQEQAAKLTQQATGLRKAALVYLRGGLFPLPLAWSAISKVQSALRADTERIIQSGGAWRRTPGAPTGLERDLKPISKCGRPTPLRSQSITPPQTVTTALTHGSREAQAVAFATAFTQA